MASFRQPLGLYLHRCLLVRRMLAVLEPYTMLAVLTIGILTPVSAQEPEEAPPAEPTELALPLLERDPFDRITLNAENDNAVIETVLLDLPERRVPDPFPDDGSIKLRRLS